MQVVDSATNAEYSSERSGLIVDFFFSGLDDLYSSL